MIDIPPQPDIQITKKPKPNKNQRNQERNGFANPSKTVVCLFIGFCFGKFLLGKVLGKTGWHFFYFPFDIQPVQYFFENKSKHQHSNNQIFYSFRIHCTKFKILGSEEWCPFFGANRDFCQEKYKK